MTPPITRRITFCAGHRVHGHETKCKHLHGHNYVARVLVGAAGLDTLGRVVDFSVIKEKVGGWIDDNWDHAFIVWDCDHQAFDALRLIEGQRIYRLPANPTAENLATHLLQIAQSLLGPLGLTVIRVDLEETENCSATAYASFIVNVGQVVAPEVKVPFPPCTIEPR